MIQEVRADSKLRTVALDISQTKVGNPKPTLLWILKLISYQESTT
jgi:hypothetical protein